MIFNILRSFLLEVLLFIVPKIFKIWPAEAAAVVCTGANAASFPINVSGTQCHGLEHIHNAHSAEACAKHCCSEVPSQCSVWQFDRDLGCWIGTPSSTRGALTGGQTPSR